MQSAFNCFKIGDKNSINFIPVKTASAKNKAARLYKKPGRRSKKTNAFFTY